MSTQNEIFRNNNPILTQFPGSTRVKNPEIPKVWLDSDPGLRPRRVHSWNSLFQWNLHTESAATPQARCSGSWVQAPTFPAYQRSAAGQSFPCHVPNTWESTAALPALWGHGAGVGCWQRPDRSANCATIEVDPNHRCRPAVWPQAEGMRWLDLP